MDLTILQTICMTLAVATSALLCAVVLAARPRGRLKWSFGVAMLGFAVEALAILMLADGSGAAVADTVFWVRAVLVMGFVVPVLWGHFVVTLAYPLGVKAPLTWRATMGAGVVIAALGAIAAANFPAESVVSGVSGFEAARLDTVAHIGAIVQLLMTVAILSGLEVCLRNSHGVVRWRMKYLLLGLGSIFLARFYLVSNAVLFTVLWSVYLKTAAATLFIGNVVIAISLARDRLAGVEFSVSRQIVYRSVVVGVLGSYLFAIGVLGWLLRRFEIPQGTFWGSLVIFVSGLGVAALLFSDALRWRVKRFIALHFYGSKYDYRQEWKAFTARGEALVTAKERAPHLLDAVAKAVGTGHGALYLASSVDDRYHLVAEVGENGPPQTVDGGSWIVQRLKSKPALLMLEGPGAAEVPPDAAAVASRWAAIIPLRSQTSLLGFMLLGHERMGTPYGEEDAEFLATAAEHVASALAMAQLSETVAQAREFEAFHRLTSFVIHDIKNSVAALSMLSRNALHNFDDPEFQRDAIKTVSSTVARMKRLLAHLAAPVESADATAEDVDLAVIADDAIATLSFDPTIEVVKELHRVTVRGDGEALLKIVQNLITNAVEALEGKGTIVVKTHEDGNAAVVSVADNGRGIPEQFLRESLFVPFRSTKRGGWGIGLYQAKEIVERYQGTISVASHVGRGTTFSVRLPLAGSSVARPNRADTQPAGTGSRA